MLPPPARRPISAYRVQFTPDFGFEAAQKIVPYLVELGVSDLYASPLFQASASSSHGYDVNDYRSISRSLGGRAGLDRLSSDMQKNGLGLLLDFVPNHMGIDGEFNLWWRHVLENGRHSKYAGFFDIEWHPRLERLSDRVLIPMLGSHYGDELENGRIVLRSDRGRFFITYGHLRLPIRPWSYGMVLARLDQHLPSGDPRKRQLRELADAFESIPPDPDDHETRLGEVREKWAKMLEADESLAKLLDVTVAEMNGTPGDALSFATLHELLENQFYRLAFWKVGAHEVNYRRFFAVDTLVGLCMENAEVFAASHKLLGELIATGIVTGIRLDHIDGLWNPAEYLQRLAALVQETKPDQAPLWTLVEKILAAPGERMPREWDVHGTTGYEFAASLIELFLDRRDEPRWTQIYNAFTGERASSADLTYEDKLFALDEIFPNAVSNLATELDSLIEFDWHKRDISLHDLKAALRHFLACLPVYRTYRMPGQAMEAQERKYVETAVVEAVRRNPCVDPLPVRFLGTVITGDYPPANCTDEQKHEFENWVCKLQQATGAVMAKSVEDTHFYRYVRMWGANEVGSHPSRFGASVSSFHKANFERLRDKPFSMLTTSTHDTKMSEDCRARLFALAELPEEWNAHLQEWHQLTAGLRREIDGRAAPDSREEYMLYQALLAAFPLNPAEVNDTFRQRMKNFFRKAQAEAKLNTTWTFPHKDWQEAGEAFIDGLFDSSEFMASFTPFAQRIAERGMIYSLAQTVLRLTSPGIPDTYQGNEVWDFSLVDPDNRRPVDFDARTKLLRGLSERSPEELLTNWTDGAIKMHVLHTLLQCRRDHPELFLEGSYQPIELDGKDSHGFVSFLRAKGPQAFCVIAPRRLDHRLNPDWNLKVSLPKGRWKNILTDDKLTVVDEPFPLSQVLHRLPVAVLFREEI